MVDVWSLADCLTLCAAGSFEVEELQQVTLNGCLTVDAASMQALQIFKVMFCADLQLQQPDIASQW